MWEASGNARPCGPHDMAPVYEKVFETDRATLEDEDFWSSVRRFGFTWFGGSEAGCKARESKEQGY